jgi:hypothetical protein
LNEEGANLVTGAVGALADEHRKEIANLSTTLGFTLEQNNPGIDKFTYDFTGFKHIYDPVNVTSLMDALSKMDYEIDSDIGSNSSSIKDLQDATGIPYADNSTYYSGLNYVGDNANLKAAIVTLDTEVNRVEGNVTNLQDITGVDGDVTGFSGLHYVADDANLKAAIETLDTEANRVEGNVTNLQDITGVDGNVTGFSGLNYVDDNANLKAAIESLDNQMVNLGADDIENIKNAVGLDDEGNLTIHGDYIENAANLKNAVELLDDRARLFEKKLIHLHNALYADDAEGDYSANLTGTGESSVIESGAKFWTDGSSGFDDSEPEYPEGVNPHV